MQIKAIDISTWNVVDDFVKVRKAGIKVVIVRNGYLNKTDDRFKAHMTGAIKAGLDVGTYTYIMSDTVEQARSEARQTLERLKPYRGNLSYPVFCDMEDKKYYDKNRYSTRIRTDIIKAFCEEIAKGGYYPALYINPSWLLEWTYKGELLPEYDVWLAHWTNSPAKKTKYDFGQTMWQWGKGPVSGVKEQVDGDLVYIDYPTKIRAAGKNFLHQKPTKTEYVHDVYTSLGRAAIRCSCHRDGDDNIITRCEKGRLYPVDAVITVGGAKWISHVGMVGYSMLNDGGKLFDKTGAYELLKATAALNVRSSPQIAKGNELGRLSKGAEVYCVGEASGGWKEILYGNGTAFISGAYVKKA